MDSRQYTDAGRQTDVRQYGLDGLWTTEYEGP